MALPLIDTDLQYDTILITIDKDLLNLLYMAALFPLFPELAAASAEIHGITALDRLLQGLLVHVGYHQNLTCLGLLGNGWNQS
jgi:hypothetical protein